MRRPRDWGHPCPNASARASSCMNRGNVSAISTYMTESGKRRIFRCQRCETPFSEPGTWSSSTCGLRRRR